MLSVRAIVVLIGLVVVAAVVYKLPARWVSERIAIPGVDIDGVAGSVWHGQVTRLSVNDNPVAPVRWTLRPSALLRGRLAADIELFPQGGQIRATVITAGNDRIAAEPLSVRGPLQHIAGGTSLGPILGTIDAEFSSIELASGAIVAAVGEAEIQNLQYPANAPYGLGDYRLSCNDTDGEPVTCALRDAGRGPLELDAELTLGPASAYALRGRVRARSDAPAALRQGLMFVGPADATGNHALDFEGRFD